MTANSALRFLPPRLYAIANLGSFAAQSHPGSALLSFVSTLLQSGVQCLQFRAKECSPKEALALAREVHRINSGRAVLLMNDRADLCLAAGFDGLHLGQDDLSPAAARAILGAERIIGFSTHTLEQVREAYRLPLDYLAFGPIFPTASKSNPDVVVGLEGLRAARALTSLPLIAIGGITLANCASVIAAGADSVAVISGLFPHPQQKAAEFLRKLREIG